MPRGGKGEAFPEPFLHHQICDKFRSISRKVYEKPNSIEELAELREWMKGIPEKLVELEVRGTCEMLRGGCSGACGAGGQVGTWGPKGLGGMGPLFRV